MSLEIIDGRTTILLDQIATLALAMVLLMLGEYLRKKVSLLEKFCFPAPVIGGLSFSIVNLILHMTGILSFSLDTGLQSPAMIAFFTCIGFGLNLRTLKSGGRPLLLYWGLCGFLVVMQCVISLGLSVATGLEPIYGVLAGATTMVGGHGNGGSFGQTTVDLGFPAGLSVGLACATFGLISGSLVGGPFANHLISKFRLKPSENDYEYTTTSSRESGNAGSSSSDLLYHVAVIAVIMAVGEVLIGKLSGFLGNVTLPAYVGGMFLAVFVRNINDRVGLLRINLNTIDRMSDIFLGVFLSMAMMSMELWQLVDLAVPLLIILFAQVIFAILYGRFAVFPLLGKDYDAAVMCSGLMGHGLGATPNGIANMTAVIQKNGPSKKAMFIVPTVAAALLDLILLPCIVISYNIAVAMTLG